MDFVTLSKVRDITSNIVYWYRDSWVLRQTSHRVVLQYFKEHNIQKVIIIYTKDNKVIHWEELPLRLHNMIMELRKCHDYWRAVRGNPLQDLCYVTEKLPHELSSRLWNGETSARTKVTIIKNKKHIMMTRECALNTSYIWCNSPSMLHRNTVCCGTWPRSALVDTL